MPTARICERIISERKMLGIRSEIELRFESSLRLEVDIDSDVSPVVLAASEVKG